MPNCCDHIKFILLNIEFFVIICNRIIKLSLNCYHYISVFYSDLRNSTAQFGLFILDLIKLLVCGFR